MIRTDRIFGVVVILVALAYIASAYNLPPGNVFDKLGPKAFPIVIGIGMAICAAVMVLRPDAEPDWPGQKTLLSLAFATAMLIGYAYALKPMGFLAPTAIAAAVLSYQISPKRVPAILTGLGLSIGLFIIFKYALGLSLFALPRSLTG
ncbi:MAG: tripartite tricarboxylate transporter TctB family protein [Rhodobacteraceae bacterium]|nr:tripartite tricarboxylate transporter TctB family protein [Paracoccaceae bacterium]